MRKGKGYFIAAIESLALLILCIGIGSVVRYYNEVRNQEKETEDKRSEEQDMYDLIAENMDDTTIRVRITQNEQSYLHAELIVQSEKDFVVYRQEKQERISAGEPWTIQEHEMETGEMIRVESDESSGLQILNLERSCGSPVYSGVLKLYREEGGIVMINELPLETYLCSVVSSEMPSSYPEEAQKAQAVCARTYAWNCMQNPKGTPEYDLDDTVNYQVYNNIAATEQSKKAVERTRGERLLLDEVLYYSTSCLTEKREDLGTEEAFEAFICADTEKGAEYDSPWIRWKTEIMAEDILRAAHERYDLGGNRVLEVNVSRRKKNGQAEELYIKTENEECFAENEYVIRNILTTEHAEINLQDGSCVLDMKMLPSAFFIIETTQTNEEGGIESVTVYGGGYGHGIGMSQNGAAEMAEKGMDYREILAYYYNQNDCVYYNENFEKKE